MSFTQIPQMHLEIIDLVSTLRKIFKQKTSLTPKVQMEDAYLLSVLTVKTPE